MELLRDRDNFKTIMSDSAQNWNHVQVLCSCRVTYIPLPANDGVSNGHDLEEDGEEQGRAD